MLLVLATGQNITVSVFSVKAAFKFRPDCGTNVAVTHARRSQSRSPLDSAALELLALHYVGRYATTRAKLAAYLDRKLRERGWNGEKPADPHAIAERFSELGYINDRAFAEARAESLARRGYGARRISEALKTAGIVAEDSFSARQIANEKGWEAALRFARRKRIGPYAVSELDEISRRKAFAAMIRAGHPFEFARILLDSAPGEFPDAPN